MQYAQHDKVYDLLWNQSDNKKIALLPECSEPNI